MSLQLTFFEGTFFIGRDKSSGPYKITLDGVSALLELTASYNSSLFLFPFLLSTSSKFNIKLSVNVTLYIEYKSHQKKITEILLQDKKKYQRERDLIRILEQTFSALREMSS